MLILRNFCVNFNITHTYILMSSALFGIHFMFSRYLYAFDTSPPPQMIEKYIDTRTDENRCTSKEHN